MKVKATIFSVSIDDDRGTESVLFATEREAVEYVVLQCIDCPKADQQSLIASYYDDGEDFYDKIREYKSDFDTYSISSHQLELEAEPLQTLAPKGWATV